MNFPHSSSLKMLSGSVQFIIEWQCSTASFGKSDIPDDFVMYDINFVKKKVWGCVVVVVCCLLADNVEKIQ